MCEVCYGHSEPLKYAPKWGRRELMRAAVGGAAALALPACATNPETGRSQLILIDESQLAEASLQAWAQVRQQTPTWNNAAAQRRLETVGSRVVTAAGRGNQRWEFVLFDSPQKNAFVLPGGQVGFYRGLMELSQRDDWIATVLGHEVGHVTGRHAAERYSREVATQTALQAAGTRLGDTAMAALGLGAQVGLSLPFSREQEAEADILGIGYMRRANYDVRESIPFWAAMAAGSSNRGPTFLSTHPDPAQRIERIRAHINAQGWGPV
jgi:predicted Zn-dependent protease